MKIKRFTLLTILIITIFISSSIAIAQESTPRSSAEPLAAVGTGFTYQGYLKDGGGPVNGTCDFRFNLYDDGFSPSHVAGPVDRGAVTVSNGYFSTAIDFGSGAFTGEGRQLQIAVRCPAGSGSYDTLSGMVSLTAAPYTIGLMPGTTISSDTEGELGAVLYVEDTYSGIFASTAFMGKSTKGTGIHGESFNGYGVYGKSTSNKAVYADGDAHVEGDLTWKAKTSFISISTAAFIPESYGTSTYVDYQNEGYYLINESSSSQWFVAPVQLPHGAVVTDLQVGWRDGSDTSATVYLRRRSMLDVTETGVIMADVTSDGSLGLTKEGVWNDDTISFATIDNENYTYYLDVGMQDATEDIKLYGVVIEYTISETY